MINFYDRYIPSENKEHARSEVVCDGADHINQVRHRGTAYAELADTFDEVLNALNGAANELTGNAFVIDSQAAVKETGNKKAVTSDGKTRFSEKFVDDLTDEVVLDLMEHRWEMGEDTYFPVRKNTPELLITSAKERLNKDIVDRAIFAPVKKAVQTLDYADVGKAPENAKPHNLTPQDYLDIINGMDDPNYIVYEGEDRRGKDRYGIIVKYYDGKMAQNGFAAISIDDDPRNPDLLNGYPGGAYHIDVTTFNLDDLQRYLDDESNVVIYDKTKDSPQGSYARQGASLLNGESSVEDRIPPPGESVKSRASSSLIDHITDMEYLAAADRETRFSTQIIIGDSGHNYGMGVYLDSGLLENLTESERVQMVAERVNELGGQSFIAHDKSGNPVEVSIAEKGRRFKNQNGKRVPVNQDLLRKYYKKPIKQESVVLANELIETANYKGKTPARHPHDWLDDNGANPWDEWTVYVQDKNKTVWEATLHIANTTDGEKILYDIDPIKMVEQRGTSRTSTTNAKIPQSANAVNSKFSAPATDSEGNALSEGQQEYFKDSFSQQLTVDEKRTRPGSRSAVSRDEGLRRELERMTREAAKAQDKLAYGEVTADDVIELAARDVDMAKIEAITHPYCPVGTFAARERQICDDRAMKFR